MAKFYCPTKLSENISETPEGYLLCVGVPIGRTGVMEYGQGETPLEVGDDGIVYVSREAKELFNKKTIASFEGKSVTIRHPEEFVNPTNWKELTKGTLHNVRESKQADEDGEFPLLADVLITERFAIGLVKNGLREVSCGYEAEYEQTGKGKGRQTNIVGNHLALVEEGRAGSSYAIQDHKRKVIMGNKIAEKLKRLFGQTIDEAMAEMVAENGKITKKTKTKIKDESATPKASKAAGSETNVVMDEEEKQKAYDEMKAAHDAMGKMLDSMKPAKDESEEEEEESEDESEEKPEPKEKEKKAKDEDAGFEERLKALEVAIAKLLEGQSEDESEEEESEDESEEGEEESEDEDLEGEEGEGSQKKTGDAALAEILVPGFKIPKKGDVKVAALQAAMKDEDTKQLIIKLNGGKKPTFDSAEKVSSLFLAASEVMKLRNGTGLEKTKDTKTKPITFESFDSTKEDMSAEKMNDLNAAHYSGQKAGK